MSGDIDPRLMDAERAENAGSYGCFSVVLNDEEAAAVEGWRLANNIPTTESALRELVRLGLLSELSQAYDVVKSIRNSVDN